MKDIYHGNHKLTISDFKNLKTIRNGDIARAISTKLVRDPSNKGLSGYEGKMMPDASILNKISEATASNIEEYSLIFQTLPDMKIAMEIWTSCLLSPKDSVTESLSWSIENKNSEYSAELFNEMLKELKDYFETEYDLFDILKPAIEDALFKTGSYPLIIVPESSLDDIINGKSVTSTESYFKQEFVTDNEGTKMLGIGLLGDKENKRRKYGLESIIENSTVEKGQALKQIHPGLTITDNPDLLKMRLLAQESQRRLQRDRVRDRYGMESFAQVSFYDDNDKGNMIKGDIDEDKDGKAKKDRRFDTKIKNEIVQTLYKDRAYDGNQIVSMRTGSNATRLPVGNPLILKVPSESIIPVHVPGNPRDIIGAFVVLDELGNPINSVNTQDLFDESTSNAEQKRTQITSIIKQMNFYKEGCCDKTGEDRNIINELAKVYASLIEEDLLSRLSNGIYGENVEIANVEEIYRIMLSRALQGMRTQVFYCPEELLTYFAFDYNKFGIGKSLLEDGKTLAVLRSTLQYADIFSRIQNSIGRRKLMITVDETDPDPLKTIETARTEYIRVNSWNMPLMSDSPVDAVNILREANVDTVIQGDNPNIPNTQIEMEDVNINRLNPDDNLKDTIKNMHLASIGLPATIVDETQNTQFATQAMNAHALFNQRVTSKQKIIATDLLWDHVSKYTLNSGYLITKLSHVIKDNKELLTDKQRGIGSTLPIIEDFLNNLTIELPSPNLQKIDEQSQDFDKYVQFITSIVENRFPDEVLQLSLPKQLADDADRYRKILISSAVQKYISENGYSSEIENLLSIDNAKDTIEAEITSYALPFSLFARDAALALNAVRRNTSTNQLNAVKDESGGDYGSDDGGSMYSDNEDDNFIDDDLNVGDGSDLDEQLNGEEDGSNPTDDALNDVEDDIGDLGDLAGLDTDGKKQDDLGA